MQTLVILCTSAAIALSAQAKTIDRLDASVNTSLVLQSDVVKFRETLPLRSQLDPLFSGTSLAPLGRAAKDSDIIEFLVDEKIIAQQFPVSDSEVEQEINQIQANNRIDRQTLKHTLKEQGHGFEDYFELIRTSAAKRNLIDRDIRAKVSIADTDIKNYFYNRFLKGSSAPLSYKVRMISVSQQNYKKVAEARAAADRALKEIRAGAPFEEVAKRTSDDPSGPSGGDLGTLTDDQMSPLVRDNLKKLQLGQVSDIINGPGGSLLILKLVDVFSSETERFNKMREEIRNQLATAEYQHQIQLWLDRNRQKSFIHRAGAP